MKPDKYKELIKTDKLVLEKKDNITINCNATNTSGIITKITDIKNAYDETIEENNMMLKLTERPICVRINDKIAISKRIENNLSIIGLGIVLGGEE